MKLLSRAKRQVKEIYFRWFWFQVQVVFAIVKGYIRARARPEEPVSVVESFGPLQYHTRAKPS